MKYSYKDTFEIPDFFDDPFHVRYDAIRHKDDFVPHHKTSHFDGIFPGYRLYEDKIDPNIIKFIYHKLTSIFTDRIASLKIHYHLVSSSYGLGFPHQDLIGEVKSSEKLGVGLIYMNLELPSHDDDYGTTIYHENLNDWLKIIECDTREEYVSRMQIAYSDDVDLSNLYKQHFRNQCNEGKFKLTVKKRFSFEFNKFVYYDPTSFHSPGYFFGNDVSKGRLTIGTWIKFK